MQTLRLFVALWLFAFTITSSWAQGDCFGTPQVFSTGTNPGSVATGDVDGDGHPDFVVGYSGGCNVPGVAVYKGKGDGTFRQKNLSSNPNPYQVALADLNKDGFADVIAAYGGSCGGGRSGIDVLLSNGDGTFKVPRSYHAGRETSRLAVGDFNNDGNLDIIASDAQYGGQNLLLGRGDGRLQPAMRVPEVKNVSGSWDIAVADFNNDGNLDFVFAAYSPQIVVQLGNGDGSFGRYKVIPVGGNAANVAAGDVNLDGKPDIVVVSNNIMTVFLGNGDGTFQKKASYPAPREYSPVIADMGSDGIPDVLLGDRPNPPDFKLLKGRGDGTFRAKVQVATGVETQHIQVADFNSDGLLDVVGLSTGWSGFATVLLNTGECR